MRLKSGYKNSNIAWSPSAESPNLLACGTSANSMGADFDTAASLDIIRFDLKTASSNDIKEPIGTMKLPSRFSSIAWGLTGSKSKDIHLGIVAGGSDSGVITFWNAAKIVS
jgi:hypothetical protein